MEKKAFSASPGVKKLKLLPLISLLILIASCTAPEPTGTAVSQAAVTAFDVDNRNRATCFDRGYFKNFSDTAPQSDYQLVTYRLDNRQFIKNDVHYNYSYIYEWWEYAAAKWPRFSSSSEVRFDMIAADNHYILAKSEDTDHTGNSRVWMAGGKHVDDIMHEWDFDNGVRWIGFAITNRFRYQDIAYGCDDTYQIGMLYALSTDKDIYFSDVWYGANNSEWTTPVLSNDKYVYPKDDITSDSRIDATKSVLFLSGNTHFYGIWYNWEFYTTVPSKRLQNPYLNGPKWGNGTKEESRTWAFVPWWGKNQWCKGDYPAGDPKIKINKKSMRTKRRFENVTCESEITAATNKFGTFPDFPFLINGPAPRPFYPTNVSVANEFLSSDTLSPVDVMFEGTYDGAPGIYYGKLDWHIDTANFETDWYFRPGTDYPLSFASDIQARSDTRHLSPVVDDPTFDAVFYSYVYPDLLQNMGYSYSLLYDHWINHGISESRVASPVFDSDYYNAGSPDLQRAYRTNYIFLRNHFLATTVTSSENRIASEIFDVSYYRSHYPDVAGMNNKQAMAHFMTIGMNEGRQGSATFWVKAYLSNYVDLQNAFGADYKHAIAHWYTDGKREGRNPLPIITSSSSAASSTTSSSSLGASRASSSAAASSLRASSSAASSSAAVVSSQAVVSSVKSSSPAASATAISSAGSSHSPSSTNNSSLASSDPSASSIPVSSESVSSADDTSSAVSSLDSSFASTSVEASSMSNSSETASSEVPQSSDGSSSVPASIVSSSSLEASSEAASSVSTSSETSSAETSSSSSSSLPGSSAAASSLPAGLIFYNSLDGPAAVTNPAYGGYGTLFGAERFMSGYSGGAYRAWVSGVEFTNLNFPGPRGCIEFWARLISHPETVPEGESPAFVRIFEPGHSADYMVLLSANNGLGGGGLSARVGTGTWAHSYFTSNNSFEDCLSNASGDSYELHHYALAWDVTNLPGTNLTLVLLLDGKPVRQGWYVNAPGSIPLSNLTIRISNEGSWGGYPIVDELKVWDFPKTEFPEYFSNQAPVWETPEGFLTNYYDLDYSYINLKILAVPYGLGNSVTYSLKTGSLPAGMVLDGATGTLETAMSPALETNVNSEFTIEAIDRFGNKSERTFSILHQVSLNGASANRAAPSADYLRKELGITTAGAYYIKPSNFDTPLYTYCLFINDWGVMLAARIHAGSSRWHYTNQIWTNGKETVNEASSYNPNYPGDIKNRLFGLHTNSNVVMFLGMIHTCLIDPPNFGPPQVFGETLADRFQRESTVIPTANREEYINWSKGGMGYTVDFSSAPNGNAAYWNGNINGVKARFGFFMNNEPDLLTCDGLIGFGLYEPNGDLSISSGSCNALNSAPNYELKTGYIFVR